MTAARKIAITCAITGSAHTPTMSRYLPITPDEIAAEAIAAAEAGASIVHLHARDPETGQPTYDPEVYGAFLGRIRQTSDVVINITTGGTGPIEQRMAAAIRFKPELASLNMGSLSPYGRQHIAERYSNWKHAWEPEVFAGARSRTYENTEESIETIIRGVGQSGTRFECECYDLGQLYNLAYFLDRGLLEPPLMIQTIFGFSGGMGIDPENLVHVRAIADKLFGSDYHWSVLAPGRYQFKLCTMAAIMGGNTRVGLEDNLYLEKGRLAKSNAEQVARMREILEALSFEIATPDDVRNMFSLKAPPVVAPV